MTCQRKTAATEIIHHANSCRGQYKHYNCTSDTRHNGNVIRTIQKLYAAHVVVMPARLPFPIITDTDTTQRIHRIPLTLDAEDHPTKQC